MTNVIQSVGLAGVGSGISLVAGAAGTTVSPILLVKSLVAGTGINIVADASTDVTISATYLPPLVSLVTAHVHWVAGGASPSNLPIFTAAFPMIVTAIIGRVESSSITSPATLTLVKAPNSVAISAGLPFTTSVFDATATRYINQSLTLVSDVTVLMLAVGDSIGVRTTGTWTTAAGGITVHLAPYPN